MREGVQVEDPKHTQEPQNHRNDDDTIQDRANARLHRNEAVDKPQQESHDDQSDDDVNQHTMLSLRRFVADRVGRKIPISWIRGLLLAGGHFRDCAGVAGVDNRLYKAERRFWSTHVAGKDGPEGRIAAIDGAG